MSSSPIGVHTLVRRTHEDRVLRILRERGALSRGEIARFVGLSRTTLSEITGSLLARGAIVVVDTDATGRTGSGRPAERLALDPRSGQLMGVDFGHRRVHIAIADAAHEIIASGVCRYDDDDDWPARIAAAFSLVDRLTAQTGAHFGALQAIAIGMPGIGTLSAQRGEIEGADPGDAVNLAFQDRFGATILIDNNTRFAGLAEAINSPDGAVKDLIYIRASDGIGGGVVVGGRLISGAHGLAGELGHIRAVAAGYSCRCGKDGCLETIASISAVVHECRARGLDVATLEDLRVVVEKAHPVAEGVLRDAAAALGRVVAAAALTLNPAEIVIGGEIVRIAPSFLAYATTTLRYELHSEAGVVPTVRAAVLGDDAGALGALAALFHRSPLLADYPEPASQPIPLQRTSA